MKDKLDVFKKELGKILLERRLNLRLTQEDVAHRAGLHRAYISDIEHGKRNISVNTYARLAQTLESSVSTLMKEAEERVLLTEEPDTIWPANQVSQSW